MRKERYISMTDIIKSKRKILVGDSYVDVPKQSSLSNSPDNDTVIQNLRETINSQAQIIAELSRIRHEFEQAIKDIQVTLNDLKQSIKDSRNE